MIDFYSDTQTRPTRAMRESILDIETGDERHDEDPKTLELCERVAGLFGMEKAVFSFIKKSNTSFHRLTPSGVKVEIHPASSPNFSASFMPFHVLSK